MTCILSIINTLFVTIRVRDIASHMAEFISTSDECSLVEATIQEIQHFSAELLRIKTSLLGARIPAPWLCRDMLSNSVKALKQAAKQASDTCTKIGVVGLHDHLEFL